MACRVCGRAGVATCACACARRNSVIERRSRRSDRRCDRGRRSALGARTLKTVGAGALCGSISSTRRVRVRARRPRRGEAGGSCRSSRLGGGAWVRPLGYKTPLYSSDDPRELNWRAASGAVRSCAELVLEYCSSSPTRQPKFTQCGDQFVRLVSR